MIKTLFKLTVCTIMICFLFSCSHQKTTVITTNNFIQTDYDYNCLENDKTFTEIILCYQAQDKSEKVQNKITNDLIKEGTN